MASHFLLKGDTGESVRKLKTALAGELGASAAAFPGLGTNDAFDAETEAALRHWQAGIGAVADGIAGPHCRQLLRLAPPVAMEIKPELAAIRALFPQTKPSNIVRFLPYITDALEALGLVDRPMILAALGTIRAETAGFVPISEFPSRFNTLPGKPPFSAYEPGTRRGELLGNRQSGDGARYCGRGFIQLTGADNYQRYSKQIGLDTRLTTNPELANAPEVAAVLLAQFLANCADRMRAALARGDYGAARKLVNGGAHGLEEFRQVFRIAEDVWPDDGRLVAARPEPGLAGAGAAAAAGTQQPQVRRTRDTRKDPPDLRDRPYQPAPILLPDAHPPEKAVREYFAEYRSMVLDQGADSSCTGYGLACVINFARWQKAGYAPELKQVSARMLYNYARRYDEYEGEDYDGSSCRGALKGWFNHGVCLEPDWPDHTRPRFGYAERAAQTTLGVYYRIDTQSITDLQAAIVQSQAIYVSAYTHEGWTALQRDAEDRGTPTHDTLPAIAFSGKASKSDGHAFAIVGFNSRGFIVQNSWGRRFGIGGFAVLTYEDWLANAMDAWVASLGVPGVVQGRLAAGGTDPKGRAGKAVDKSRWWDAATAYEHSVVVGNDGRVSRYLSQDELSRSLLYQACALPDHWFRTDPRAMAGARKRLVIYAHGGLNSEADAIERARAMGRFFIGNGCYPLFLVWKTGMLESLADAVEDAFRQAPGLVGGARERLLDATDALLERLLGRGPGKLVWSEMKENARFSCMSNRAGDYLAQALQKLAATWGEQLEIHLIGHSAGSIILGHLLEEFARRDLKERIASAHLFAPACTVQFANRYYAPHEELLKKLWLHVLSDDQERDDNVVAIYRKSLLYMVSNALEPDLRTPLLGMANVEKPDYVGWDGSSTTMEALSRWRFAARDARLDQRTVVVSGPRVPCAAEAGKSPETIAASHGSFDNNVEVIARTLKSITGLAQLPLPVDDLRGF
ncbi:hypothetical protein GCM10028796_26500 [Ramlibacter monticola]|uniref:Peptidase C1 n=1 Tax=Ramlibacter monticola TaxID=1926872 RepID=A0A936Z4D7_9BURK|nr:peptidase C1 [Ramlibacter monticola]MBL0393704.1 peptidase C1 [Ramlibacter monticola]